MGKVLKAQGRVTLCVCYLLQPSSVTLLATPALLLFADIIGRVIVPGELRVSVVSAFIGAPVLIFLVRRKTRGGA